MSYKLTNISGGQIVCDLVTKGETLRLNNKQSRTIEETEITSHIKNLIEKDLILSELVPTQESNTVTKKTAITKNSKEKED